MMDPGDSATRHAAVPTEARERPAGPAGSDSAWELARRIFVAYLYAQALAGIAFWALFWNVSAVRETVELAVDLPAVTEAFLLADAVIVATSAVGAYGLQRQASWTPVVLGFTTGGLVYPTLFLVAWVAAVGTGSVCLAIMVPPSVLTAWITWQVWRAHQRIASA